MKHFLVFLISVYQFFSPLLHSLLGIKKGCKYKVSCSQYAKEIILKKGAIKGGILSIKRLLSCW